MAFAGATRCSTGVGTRKVIKIWREVAEYIPKVDRARILRREGSVTTCSLAALKYEMEKSVGQQQRLKPVVGYCSCEAPYPSHVQRSGNREAGRVKQRANRERLKDK